MARLLHAWSPREDKAFVTVNSARITPERFEQELFGEEADGKLVRAAVLAVCLSAAAAVPAGVEEQRTVAVPGEDGGVVEDVRPGRAGTVQEHDGGTVPAGNDAGDDDAGAALDAGPSDDAGVVPLPGFGALSGVCDVLAHPDLCKVTGRRPAVPDEWHARMAEAAVRSGMAAEVSSAGPKPRRSEGSSVPEMRIHRPGDFFARLGDSGLIGLGESYMAKDWTAPDLTAVIEVFAQRAAHLVPVPLQKLRGLYLPKPPRRERNTTANTRSNISRHYDLSNELFALFLDNTMSYSSALFDGVGTDLLEVRWLLSEEAGSDIGDEPALGRAVGAEIAAGERDQLRLEHLRLGESLGSVQRFDVPLAREGPKRCEQAAHRHDVGFAQRRCADPGGEQREGGQRREGREPPGQLQQPGERCQQETANEQRQARPFPVIASRMPAHYSHLGAK